MMASVPVAMTVIMTLATAITVARPRQHTMTMTTAITVVVAMGMTATLTIFIIHGTTLSVPVDRVFGCNRLGDEEHDDVDIDSGDYVHDDTVTTAASRTVQTMGI